MTNFETLRACVRAEASSLPPEQADDLDDEPRRDDSLDAIFKEESQDSGELDDALPEGVPDYADLLDSAWLERGADGLDMEGDVVDVGLTLDLDDRDELEDAGLAIEFDVGSLLTLLPSEALPSEGSTDVELREQHQRPLGSVLPSDSQLHDGSFGANTLKDLLLPEENDGIERGDQEVGDDERFPVFDDAELVPRASPTEDEDAPGGGDRD